MIDNPTTRANLSDTQGPPAEESEGAPPLTRDELDRYAERLRPPDANGCVRWSGQVCKGGWGRFRVRSRGKTMPAHHVAWLLYFGTLPGDKTLEVDHLCQVRDCVEVTHLEWVTRLENQRRIDLRRAECRRGLHDWRHEPAYYRFGSQVRVCFACEASPKRQKPKRLRYGYRRGLVVCPRGHDVKGENGYDIRGFTHRRGCWICTNQR